jgi:hypothetical protein
MKYAPMDFMKRGTQILLPTRRTAANLLVFARTTLTLVFVATGFFGAAFLEVELALLAFSFATCGFLPN